MGSSTANWKGTYEYRPASDSALPTATIIGAAAGGAIGALLIVGVGVYLCMKSKKTVAPTKA